MQRTKLSLGVTSRLGTKIGDCLFANGDTLGKNAEANTGERKTIDLLET
jgi:hypothetical protein